MKTAILFYSKHHGNTKKPHGAPAGGFLKGIRAVTESRKCKELGEYRCQGFDTFGPFKLVGGIAKGHPTKAEIDGAVKFYRELPDNRRMDAPQGNC